MSTNGGQSWNAAVSISSAPSRGEDGGLRSPGLPSTAVDGAGNVYVSWPDCRFESGCSANDIVYSSSSDGINWSPVVRVPIDPIGSGVDHFIHGMGIDTATSGSLAHMAITYYYYPVANCGNSCTLTAGYTQSSDGGATWTAGRPISHGMQLSWLPNSQNGLMVADYVATVFSATKAFPIYVIAQPKSGGLFQAGSLYGGLRLDIQWVGTDFQFRQRSAGPECQVCPPAEAARGSRQRDPFAGRQNASRAELGPTSTLFFAAGGIWEAESRLPSLMDWYSFGTIHSLSVAPQVAQLQLW